MFYNQAGETPPDRVSENGRTIINPGALAAWRTANGYTLTENPIPPPVVPSAVVKYSKRKIILALGDGWAIKKAELENAGLWDLFTQSTYLCEDDPTFAAIYASLSEDEKELLAGCLYE